MEDIRKTSLRKKDVWTLFERKHKIGKKTYLITLQKILPSPPLTIAVCLYVS